MGSVTVLGLLCKGAIIRYSGGGGLEFFLMGIYLFQTNMELNYFFHMLSSLKYLFNNQDQDSNFF
jgi:hypothetical protein